MTGDGAMVAKPHRGPVDPLAKARMGAEIISDEVSYFYVNRGLENRIIAVSSFGVPLELPDPATGIPMPPTPRMITAAMRAHRLFLRSDQLPDPVRAAARAEEPTGSDVWHKGKDGFYDRCDQGAKLRDLVVRAWDALAAEERPMLTDTPLQKWVEERKDMAEALAAYGRTPVGSTLRNWIRSRGAADDRRVADMPSRTGKVKRSRRFHELVLVIGRMHALALVSSRRKSKVEFTRFERTVAKADRGEEVVVDGATLVYEKPTERLRAYKLTTFRLECRRARSMMTDQARRGAGARKQLHGGGGAAQEPVRYLQIVQQDDSPFPNWFLIDPVNRVPVGVATVVITMCIYTKVILGWDVSLEAASTSTWLRALAHCGLPKPVPARLQSEFPELEDLYGWITGKVVYDNALQNIGHAAQDAAGDLAHAITIAGEGEATHKSEVERTIQTIQGYMSQVDGMTLDIPLMRKFGYDARKHVVVTVDQFRTMLDEAIQTYHTQEHDGLAKRSPLQVWSEQVAQWGHHQAKDIDQFLRSIGDVTFTTFDRTGFEVDGLRYTAGVDGNEQLLADFASVEGAAVNDKPMSFSAKVKTYGTVAESSIFNPKTRRYVPVPCAFRRYATGMPTWLHHRIMDFIGMTKAEFRTEQQMRDAAEAFTASLEAAMPEATARQMKLYGAVLDAPNVRRHLGSDVVIRHVAASANGMTGDAVLHSGRADSRKDGMMTTARPRRGGANVKRAQKRAAAEQKVVADLAAAALRRASPKSTASRSSVADPSDTSRENARRNAAIKAGAPLRPGSFR